MAVNPEAKDKILRGMEEIEAITSMLTRLKQDMTKKENLLGAMEKQIKLSEKRLERKVAEIDEKDKSLKEIESKMNRRQEELRIQEQDVQTNAILQFLTFQAREMEVQKKAEQLEASTPAEATAGASSEEVDVLKGELLKKEEEILELKKELASQGIPDAAPVGGEKPDRLKEFEASLQEMKNKLGEKEIELLRKEEDLKKREHRLSQGGGGDRPMQDREKELLQMEEKLRAKQKELSEFNKGLEAKEKKIRDLEEELKYKEELIKMKEEKDLSSIQDGDVEKVKQQLEEEYRKRSRLIEEKNELKIDNLKREVDRLRGRNEELEQLGDQLESDKLRTKILERELKERVNELAFQEERLARRQELMLKERKQIDEQLKRFKSMKDGTKVSELNEELANKQKQLKELESKFREKEEYLRKKERELRDVESGLVDKEIMEEMRVESESELSKVRTGIRRFDDLVYGGFPHSSNMLLFGPAYSGRTTFSNLFIAEGLKKGTPCIYITTQHTPEEIKDQLRGIIPKIDAYEEKGLMKYVDLYSTSMGIKGENPNVVYVEKTSDLDALQKAVETMQEEIRKEHKYHRMVFFSLSTMLTYVEPLQIFRFFQVLNAKNKRSGASSITIVDKGMHDPSVIQTLKHVMSGFLEFKHEDLKYYLRVEGGGDVMSRAWIEYTFTDKTFDLRGSFALDHIR